MYELQKASAHYLDGFKDEKKLKSLPYRKLHEGFLELEELINQTNHSQGRIIQTIETLAINHDNFKAHLIKLPVEQPNWCINWDMSDKYDNHPPLLNEIQKNIEQLKSHRIYIEGKLIDVKSAKDRWDSYIKEGSHALLENLGHIGHLIVFLVALAEMGHFLKNISHTDHSTQPIQNGILGLLNHYESLVMALLQNQHFYVIVFTLIMMYVLWVFMIKKMVKYLMYHLFHKWRKI